MVRVYIRTNLRTIWKAKSEYPWFCQCRRRFSIDSSMNQLLDFSSFSVPSNILYLISTSLGGLSLSGWRKCWRFYKISVKRWWAYAQLRWARNRSSRQTPFLTGWSSCSMLMWKLLCLCFACAGWVQGSACWWLDDLVPFSGRCNHIVCTLCDCCFLYPIWWFLPQSLHPTNCSISHFLYSEFHGANKYDFDPMWSLWWFMLFSPSLTSTKTIPRIVSWLLPVQELSLW